MKNNKKVLNERTHNPFNTYKKKENTKIGDTFDHKHKTENLSK